MAYSFTIFSFFLFFSITISSLLVNAIKHSEKHMTHLHFYLHDQVSGTSPTAVKVIPSQSNAAKLVFGDLTMIDDLLTKGPNVTTDQHVGHAQGFYAVASKHEPALLFTMNFVFEEGKFNGSTLAVLSRDAILSQVRELPVVGGTGKFRMARGYALMKTYWYNISTGDAILELDVYVWHHAL